MDPCDIAIRKRKVEFFLNRVLFSRRVPALTTRLTIPCRNAAKDHNGRWEIGLHLRLIIPAAPNIFLSKMDRGVSFRWITTGDQAAAEMQSAVREAKRSVSLEMYIFDPGPSADSLRQALIDACQRGLKIRVLLDAWGSNKLPSDYWDVLRLNGGQFRWFNPISLQQIAFRDHRKLLVCDQTTGIIGGFNVGPEFTGDGVTRGWRDLGLVLQGPLANELETAFDQMFTCSDFELPPFARLRRSSRQRVLQTAAGRLLLSSPGRNNPVKRALRNDLLQANRIQIMSAYFLPTWRLRHALTKAARRGAKVQLILPGKSDVPLSALAARSFYTRLLRSGIEIYEYQPQILHAKLILIDNIIYAGSANLDARSLSINYELTLRLTSPELATQGREIFARDLQHCHRIDAQEWRKSRNLWQRFKARLAYLVLARLDPSIARYQWRRIAARLKQATTSA